MNEHSGNVRKRNIAEDAETAEARREKTKPIYGRLFPNKQIPDKLHNGQHGNDEAKIIEDQTMQHYILTEIKHKTSRYTKDDQPVKNEIIFITFNTMVAMTPRARPCPALNPSALDSIEHS